MEGLEGLYYVLAMVEDRADIVAQSDLSDWPEGKSEPDRNEPLLTKTAALELAVSYARENNQETAVVQLIGKFVPEVKAKWFEV